MSNTEHRTRKLQSDIKKREAVLKQEGLNHILANRSSRKWLWELLATCGVFRTPFTDDPHRTAFNTGMQNIGQTILAELEAHDPEALVKMMKEEQNDRRNDRERANNIRKHDGDE